tara:strand:- start:1998 stop:2750 length:753 start_codon:yes stop_codon:yes gene_type:complete
MNELIEKKDFSITKIDLKLQEFEKTIAPVFNELENIKRVIGTEQTSHEREIGNLQMSGNSPLIWLKQCYAQINQRLEASTDTFYRLQEFKLQIQKYELKENLTPKQQIKLAKYKTNYISTEGYLENSIKEILHYKKTAEQIKKSFNINDIVSDEEMDQASTEDHVKTAFKQAIQDMTQQGSISKGTFGHLEQWGIHPYAAKFYVLNYIKNCDDLLVEGKTPNITHLYAFLEDMYTLFKDAYLDNKTRLGI